MFKTADLNKLPLSSHSTLRCNLKCLVSLRWTPSLNNAQARKRRAKSRSYLTCLHLQTRRLQSLPKRDSEPTIIIIRWAMISYNSSLPHNNNLHLFSSLLRWQPPYSSSQQPQTICLRCLPRFSSSQQPLTICLQCLPRFSSSQKPLTICLRCRQQFKSLKLWSQ